MTGVRIGWIASHKAPRDVEFAIMTGLRRIWPVLKREEKVAGYAPYGIIWYAMNLPIARLVGYSGRNWMILLALVDTVFLWLSQTLGLLGFVSYLLIGTFQLLRSPWNVTIDWIILLGLFSWWFLLIAPLAKLPVGLPLHAFRDTRQGLFHQHNYVYYGLLGTLWLIVLSAIYLPVIRDTLIIVLGILWLLALGILYTKRPGRSSSKMTNGEANRATSSWHSEDPNS